MSTTTTHMESSAAAATLLKELEAGKEMLKACSHGRGPAGQSGRQLTAADSADVLAARQQLQELYCGLLTADLELALDRKLEQELWHEGFKQPIGALQAALRDKRHPRRPELHTRLALLLEQATGFYVGLLHRLCSLFRVELPCRRRLPPGILVEPANAAAAQIAGRWPKRGSVVYLCQHCLVHLGDVARYQQALEQARTYYQWASSVGPCSGHPYNQLAILELALGQRLATVFYYVRAVACKTPFPAAATNLEKLLLKATKEPLPAPAAATARFSQSELVTLFLQLLALLQLQLDLPRARHCLERLAAALPEHLATGGLAWSDLVMLAAVHVFAHERLLRACPVEHLALVLRSLLTLAELLAAAGLAGRTEPLPALALLLRWLERHAAQLPAAPPLPRLAALLNQLSTGGVKEAVEEATKEAAEEADTPLLPEEELLRGFLPLFAAPTLSWSAGTPESGADVEQRRAGQLLARGRRLAVAAPDGPLRCAPGEGTGAVLCFSAPAAPVPAPTPAPVPRLVVAPSTSKAARNVAMQSILAAAAAQASTAAAIAPRKSGASVAPVTATPSVAASGRQPGLIVSAEIARSIQEHAAAAAAKETALAAAPPGLAVGGVGAGGAHRAATGAASSVSSAAGAELDVPGDISAAERRQLYNQNREAFQKDLPPRFARRAAAQQPAPAPQREPPGVLLPGAGISLAGKESEPLFPPAPGMWFPPPPNVGAAPGALLMPHFYRAGGATPESKRALASTEPRSDVTPSSSEMNSLYGGYSTLGSHAGSIWPVSGDAVRWSGAAGAAGDRTPPAPPALPLPNFQTSFQRPVVTAVALDGQLGGCNGQAMSSRTDSLNKSHMDYVQSLWSSPLDLLVRQSPSRQQHPKVASKPSVLK